MIAKVGHQSMFFIVVWGIVSKDFGDVHQRTSSIGCLQASPFRFQKLSEIKAVKRHTYLTMFLRTTQDLVIDLKTILKNTVQIFIESYLKISK